MVRRELTALRVAARTNVKVLADGAVVAVPSNGHDPTNVAAELDRVGDGRWLAGGRRAASARRARHRRARQLDGLIGSVEIHRDEALSIILRLITLIVFAIGVAALELLVVRPALLRARIGAAAAH